MNPQCQFFVIRKKRLCRMTVRPGKQYCGEHEPRPTTADGQDDTRVPCPNDPKHTCYVSKLQKHLAICNARPGEDPEYIVRNVNSPAAVDDCPRLPLSEISPENIQRVVNKVNLLYDKYVKDKITSVPEQPIHKAVLEEFSSPGRTESSLRHLRQVSSLLYLVEAEDLVHDHTCYVELGAGKGRLSAHASAAWCAGGEDSGVVLVERASLRHKRDNRLPRASRLRADLAHVVLARAPTLGDYSAVVALAKHLCGAATDYALRCVAAHPAGGVVLATCCHHRCERAAYVGDLQEMGITSEEFNIILGIVSWATCGDGMSRERRQNRRERTNVASEHQHSTADNYTQQSGSEDQHETSSETKANDSTSNVRQALEQDVKIRELVGRRAKALLDWGRAQYLRRQGYDARICYFVPQSVSLENICIVAKKR